MLLNKQIAVIMEKKKLISFKVSVLEQVRELLNTPNSEGIIIAIPSKFIQGVRTYLKYHLGDTEKLVSCAIVGDSETIGWSNYSFKRREDSSERQKVYAKLKAYEKAFLTKITILPTTFQSYIAQYNQKHGTEFCAHPAGDMWRIERDYDKEAVMSVYRALKAENPENVQQSLKSLERHALSRYSLPN